MKKILFLSAILISLNAFSQKKDARAILISEQSGDTLEIRDTSIRFIKVGGDVYEIRRRVELVKVEKQNTPLLGGWGNITLDSTFLRTPNLQYYYKGL